MMNSAQQPQRALSTIPSGDVVKSSDQAKSLLLQYHWHGTQKVPTDIIQGSSYSYLNVSGRVWPTRSVLFGNLFHRIPEPLNLKKSLYNKEERRTTRSVLVHSESQIKTACTADMGFSFIELS